MKPTTAQQDRDLASLLEEGLELSVTGREIVIEPKDMSFIVDWVSEELSPDDVFDDKTLRDWALRNGFEEKE